MRVPSRIRSKSREGSEEGMVLLLVALSTVVLLGMGALSLDVGHAYDVRNKLAMSADAAAKAGAYEVWRGNSANYQAFVTKAIAEDIGAGRIPSGTTSTIRLCSDAGATCTSPYTTNKYVEVILQNTQTTFLGGAVGLSSMTPRARAVAGSASGTNCMIILGGTLDLSNNVDLNMTGCGVAAGGDLDMGNGATIEASSVAVTVGSCDTDAQNCTNHAPYPTDPLANLPAPSPAPAHTCTSPFSINSTITINVTDVDKYYCGMKFDNGNVTFGPGVYQIAGPVSEHPPGHDFTIYGDGVMFYIAPGGSWNVDSNFVTMDLSAPTSGTYSGILFYQDRANSSDVVLSKNNGDKVSLSGAMYFPSADVEMKNNNNVGLANDCTLIIAKSLLMGNNSVMSNTCSAFFGSPLTTVAMAE